MKCALRRVSIHGTGILVAFSLFGVLSVSCTKASRTKDEGAASRDIQAKPETLGAPRTTDLTPEERARQAARDAEFKDLQDRLAKLEGERANVTPASVQVSGDVSLPASLVGKELLWGSDLQYAKIKNYESGAFESSTVFALETKIARLVRVGEALLLLSRDSVDVESDYPAENVLAKFVVVSESEGTLVLRPEALGMESARVIGDWLGNVPAEGGKTFVRSMEFDAKDDTLVFELTMRDVSGAQYDFIESFQPRVNVVGGSEGLEITAPQAGDENDPSDFATLLARVGTFPVTAWHAPQAPNTSTTPSTADDLGSITKVEKSHVSRFNISGPKEIAWWVTSNIPDTLLPEIKAGVEGWNRYFNETHPGKKVMAFKGKLPASTKLGDPRYNVIHFDAVADAPGAYESQASDPLTGLQTHSMIYLPLAWYNISDARYLGDGGDASSVEDGSKGSKGKAAFMASLKKRGVIRCERPGVDMRDAVFMANSRAADTADEAGRALIRSTLLHEVGHGLGMDHNFKGTLTGDLASYNETDWVYSASTMDYNPFAMEDTLFADLSNPNRDVTKGLRQPYDAQFIDVVYNGGKLTLAKGEKAYPFCNDADHDDTVNGVDPLCRQYDFFASPDQALTVPAQRLSSSAAFLDRRLGGFVTLKGYLQQRATAALGEAKAQGETLSAKAAQDAAGAFTREMNAAFRHFLRSGSYSYVSALARETRLLGEWKPVDGVVKGTELSFHTGLEYAVKFIKGLFSPEGDVSGDAYKAYERKVQAQLAARMSELFSTGYDAASGAFLGEGKVRDGVDEAKQAQSAFFAALLERVAESEKAAMGEAFAALNKQGEAEFDANLGAASARVLQELPTIVVSSDVTGGEVGGRPAVRGSLSHTLALGLARLASRSGVDIATRTAAIDRLLVEDANAARHAAKQKVDVEKDGQTVRVLASEVRAKAIDSLVAALRSEFAPLDAKARGGRYLTADERSLHEFLAGVLSLFLVEPFESAPSAVSLGARTSRTAHTTR